MKIMTAGDIAKEIGVDRDAVTYAIRKAGIEPVGRAGIVRLFSSAAVTSVREFLSSKRQVRRETQPCAV